MMNYYDEKKMLVDTLFNEFGTINLDTKQASKALNQSEVTLKTSRALGTGVPYSRIGGRSIRYTITDVVDYILSNKMKVVA